MCRTGMCRFGVGNWIFLLAALHLFTYAQGEDIKKKWKTMRDSYLRFMKNRKRTGIAGRNSKDERHHKLWFLSKHGDSILSDEQAFDGNDDGNDDSQAGLGSDQDPIAHEENDSTQEFAEVEQKPEPIETFDQCVKIEINREFIPSDDEMLSEAQGPSKKQKCLRKTSPNVAKFWKRRDERVLLKRRGLLQSKTMAERRQKEDDVELFSRHIAEVLRNLPPIYKAEAKKQLSITLSNYEIMAARHSSIDPTE